MRLGVLGGSFNPPHIGHLLVASDAYEALALDRLMIVPASANPLKGLHVGGASAADRLHMARLTFGADPRFEVSSMEIERGGLSYTVDTLEALHSGHTDAELVLIVGMDSVKMMDKWQRPDRITELARLAILTRREADGGSESRATGLPAGSQVVTTRRIDVSSSEIRQRLAAGKRVTGFVVESVERYIAAAKLYGPPAAP